MHNKMTHTARAELANAIRRRYQSATGKEKHKILEEFIATTGYHEKSAIRVLNGEPTTKRPQTRNAFCHLRWQTARRLTGKAGSEEGESGLGNMPGEASGNKIT